MKLLQDCIFPVESEPQECDKKEREKLARVKKAITEIYGNIKRLKNDHEVLKEELKKREKERKFPDLVDALKKRQKEISEKFSALFSKIDSFFRTNEKIKRL